MSARAYHGRRRSATGVEWLWEIPLACASLLFYKAVRRLLRLVGRLYFRNNPAAARRWRVLSADTLRMPLALPLVMTSGPRWNTHAVVANVGPLRVRGSLAVATAAPDTSTAAWAIVVYRYPQHRLIARFGSGHHPKAAGSHRIELESGSYSLILRYYQPKEGAELPRVEVDGVTLVQPHAISPDVNTFYGTLGSRRHPFYLLLHYYIFTIVRFRRWLPPSFVDREVMPVGDPETEFYYEVLWPGDRCRFAVEPALLLSHHVWYTVYGRDSFPLAWGEVTAANWDTAPAPEKSLVLVRVQRKGGGRQPFDRSTLRITRVS